MDGALSATPPVVDQSTHTTKCMAMIAVVVRLVAGSRTGIVARAIFATHAPCINRHAITMMVIATHGLAAAAMIIITAEDFTSHLVADDAK